MKHRKSTSILYSVWFGAAFLAAILAAGAIVTDYDESANYFLKTAPFFWAALGCAAISLISGIAAAITTNASELNKLPFSKRPSFPPSAIGFALMAIGLAGSYYQMMQENKAPFGIPVCFFALTALILAVVYSVSSGKPSIINQKPTQTAGFGLFAILAPLLVNVYFYFDVSVEMNAPLKLLVQIGLLFAMLYYTAEVRYLLNKAKPRLFLALAAATVAVSSLSALSLFVALITSRLPRLDYLAGAVMVLSVAVTAVIRIHTLFTQEPDTDENTLDAEEPLSDPTNTPDDFSDNT